jgi:hypothetical protein
VLVAVEMEGRRLLPPFRVGDGVVQVGALHLAHGPRRPEVHVASAAGAAMRFVAGDLLRIAVAGHDGFRQ